MTTEASFKDKVELGRRAVSDYRAAHAQLHAQSRQPQTHHEHTPLLRKLESDLKEQDFGSLDEFFSASEELNLNELGFRDKADFTARAAESDREALETKWR
ncbi:MAG: hypothetical protein JW790_04805 [Dehalococcoidales bacterium]|nr:hypothetical protein [Dehalococcoidales bacterium]